MATIESLANETLCKIISMLKEPSLSPWQVNFGLNVPRNDDLLAAALVCSRWTDPAQRALCDTIKIDLRRDPLKLQQLRDSSVLPRHPTRRLDVTMADEKSWPEVVAFAELCERLETFEFRTSHGMNWNELARPCFAGLKHLILSTPRLGGKPLHRGDSVPLPVGLSSLVVMAVLDEAAEAFLAAASSASKNTLKKLRLRVFAEESNFTLHSALSVIGPNLQTFIIETWSRYFPGNHIDTFSTFKALQSFFWHGFNPNYPLKASDTANLPTILDAFPSPATLTHLSIGTDDFSSLEHIIPVLGHPTLALLTKLDLPKLPVIAPIEQASTLAAMAKACEDHGIRWSMGGIKVWSNLGACVQRTAGGAEDRGWIGRVRSEDLRLTMS